MHMQKCEFLSWPAVRHNYSPFASGSSVFEMAEMLAFEMRMKVLCTCLHGRRPWHVNSKPCAAENHANMLEVSLCCSNAVGM